MFKKGTTYQIGGSFFIVRKGAHMKSNDRPK